ncbi:hypothetical protein AB6A40_010959 [Gnathostoma spinigerum]|uniref:Spindle assembly abnormal protein 6 N-terminal domain-containing protein n=1 Tax=Gnathostoma spinigerum TaxID=75299 RepID=A0ABD6EXS2_9BILA
MSKVLFDEEINVRFSRSSGQIKEKSEISLNLRINEETAINAKIYSLYLSKEDEPQFVFTMSLHQNDYEILKKEQSLDAGFEAFPQLIIDFLRELDRSGDSFIRCDVSNDRTKCCLELIGKMGFKWVSFLTLIFHALSEKALIAHLAERVQNLNRNLLEMEGIRTKLVAEQDECNRLKHCLNETEERLKQQYEQDHIEHEKFAASQFVKLRGGDSLVLIVP